MLLMKTSNQLPHEKYIFEVNEVVHYSQMEEHTPFDSFLLGQSCNLKCLLRIPQLDLKTLLPGVPRLLKNWEKQQSKVPTFSFFELTLCRSFRKKNWKDSQKENR
jgi:hypothetical protein